MENLDIFGAFDTNAAREATESTKPSYSSEGVYKPSFKDEKCVDQTYSSVIRFIPYVQDGKAKTTVERWECFLKDVNDENPIFVVSPKTAGQNCPIRALSYKLYKSDNAIDKANSKKINVYQQWYAIIEVVKDVQHPEYNGKHFIYQFGSKIKQKIDDALKGSEFTAPVTVFDFFNAPLFEIKITKDNKKMDNSREVANYDGCKFLQKTAPIHFGDGQTLDQSDNESKKAFLKWLETDAPKISNYFFKEWDAETTQKVNVNLASYTSGYVAPKTKNARTQEILNEIANVGSTPTPKAEAPAPTPKAEETSSGKDDINVNSDDMKWLDDVLGTE